MNITLPIQLKIQSKTLGFQLGRFQMLWQFDPMVSKEEVKHYGRKTYYKRPLETGAHFLGTHLMADFYATPADLL